MRNQRIPGLALAVIREGRPVKVTGYGLANIELAVPATPDTVFRIASVSKQIMATAVMLLASEGKLDLDDPICRYIAGCPESWQPIRIRHVLTHTSGLSREAPGNSPFKVESDMDVIRRAFAAPTLSKPGDQWSYSNLGYSVLAQIISHTSGKSWSDFIAERIFAPLGMTATRTTDFIEIVPNRASGYQFRDNRQRNVPPLLALRPSGAFLSTLRDLVKWDAAVTAGTLIPNAMQEQMWTAALLTDGSSTNYGFGWWIDQVAGHRRVRHGGTNPGFRAEYARFVDEKLDVIVLANGESARTDEIAVVVAGHFIPGLSPEREIIALSPSALTAYAGQYRVSEAEVLTIAVDGPGLSIQSSTGSSQFRMLPETSSVFFISKSESYVFIREGSTVKQMEVRNGTAGSLGPAVLTAQKVQ
ncbi:beta-lactamase family protein [Steroidobacter sp. S1-65]|uniref:Beta-lactamase family protein n=2 Tax=Steroidobacter gossypii TaxID=2805490 RepID=A0ABS1WX73_9GAMM|nr:beta-lactamase family protein [Steroidobacter gossypii]